jgi:hypothetical protein
MTAIQATEKKERRGRTKMPEGEKKSVLVQVYLTPAEADILNKNRKKSRMKSASAHMAAVYFSVVQENG